MRKLRRFYAGILVGVFLSLQFLPAVFAAGSGTLFLSPASQTVASGANFNVAVRANTNGEQVNAVQANLSYPAAKLAVQSISYSGSAFNLEIESDTSTPGSIRMTRASTATPPPSGNILVGTVTFKMLATSGSAAVTFASGSDLLRASDSTSMLGSTTGGTYNVESPPPSDPPPPPSDPPPPNSPPPTPPQSGNTRPKPSPNSSTPSATPPASPPPNTTSSPTEPASTPQAQQNSPAPTVSDTEGKLAINSPWFWAVIVGLMTLAAFIFLTIRRRHPIAFSNHNLAVLSPHPSTMQVPTAQPTPTAAQQPLGTIRPELKPDPPPPPGHVFSPTDHQPH